MTEHSNSQHQSMTRPNYYELSEPLMFLSSEGRGWGNLNVCAYHEPMVIENWRDPIVPDIRIVLMTRGAMLMEYPRTNGSWGALSIQQGDLFLRPAGSIANEVRWQSTTPEPMQTLHIHLDNKIMSKTIETMADNRADNLELMGQAGFQDPLLSQIGYALWQELIHPSSVGQLYAQTAAQMIAVHLLRHYASPTITIEKPASGLSSKQEQRVKEFIQENISESLSLSELAEVIGFSEYHFARLFRQSTGYSPHQFVLRKRIERAQQLLIHTRLSISQIAIETGFTHQSHLTQAFKRQMGITPKAYRQNTQI